MPTPYKVTCKNWIDAWDKPIDIAAAATAASRQRVAAAFERNHGDCACVEENQMISTRTETIKAAVNALVQARVVAATLCDFPQLAGIPGEANLKAELERLRSEGLFGPACGELLENVRAKLIERLDSYSAGYGTLVFSQCSQEIPHADPRAERVRQFTEDLKELIRLRQAVLDQFMAERALRQLETGSV